MSGFAGFVQLDNTFTQAFVVEDSSHVPINADALPTFRVYGAAGLLPNLVGSCSFQDSGTVTGATNASPIVVTSAGHGLSTGDRVTVTGVLGNTAANGTFLVTSVSGNTFSLQGSTGNGAYVSGGAWNVTGLYKVSFAASAANGLAQGDCPAVRLTWAVSASQRSDVYSFTVT